MSLASTRGPEDPDRERRDRLEQLQVELREARAALALADEETQRSLAEQQQKLAAAEVQLRNAEARRTSLTNALRACQIRREDLRKMIAKAKVDRYGPVERVGLYNDPPGENDWRMQGRWRADWFLRQPGWLQLLLIAAFVALYVYVLSR